MSDPVEIEVASALDAAGVKYCRDAPLDFECEGFAVECKRFYTPRLEKQLSGRDDVIVVVGMKAARAFRALLATK